MIERWVAVGAVALACGAAPLRAWDATGHRVVARIAWEAMQPETRDKVVAALAAAPGDADLASLLPQDGRPRARRLRELFELASTWPDIVRDPKFPARRGKYNQPTWHYLDWYWDRPDPAAAPRDRLDLPSNPQNVVERLRFLAAALADPHLDPGQKAIDLAWVLHLVGDVHMPLHCASRVTAGEPHGDQGGNLFKLGPEMNLHRFWDDILTLTYPRQPGEGDELYITRIAAAVTAHQPPAASAARLDLNHFEAWANDGYDLAKTVVYAPPLTRGHAPGADYQALAYRTAEPAIALAGYRLAGLLERVFGN
ncbi:MAG TPA: S1/P1 nuclease [Thermoanaerobaculia bacterium]|nr:S1/P1 nuclease [Thermoanaerobaculia bacterium]